MGYHLAGFDVVGVDREPQPRYPFEFRRRDVLTMTAGEIADEFDAVHASPPCQRYSDLARRNGNADDHPDLIEPTRALLRATGLPYIIENVDGAPLLHPVVLCGTMFPGLRVLRHRLFESNKLLFAPAHPKHPLVYTRDKRKAHYGKLCEADAFVMVNGGGNCSKAAAASAMNIGWMTKGEMNEAVPPAYTEYLGRQLMAYLSQTAHEGTAPLIERLPPNTSEAA
jgi:DNA (cytosine-5)-methyltransferase 1